MDDSISLAKPLIKHFEGLYLKAYTCPAGKMTVGWGHTGHDVYEDLTISEAEANNLLEADLMEAQDDVEHLVKVPLREAELAALISFVFNLGMGALKQSTLLRVLNAGDKTAASMEFLKWNKAHVNGELVALRGLTRRRLAESTLFLTEQFRPELYE